MSGSTTARRARRVRRAQTAGARPPSSSAVDAVFLAGIAAVGVIAAWPIYRDPWLLATAIGGFALATGIAAVSTARRWRWWRVVLAVAAVYLLAGVPLAAPTALTDPSRLPQTALELLTAPVTGWKNLLTLDLPLGTYRATLAPALLVFLVVPVVSLSLAWRGARTRALAVPAALVLPLFGIAFGSSAVRGTLALGPVAVPGTVELFVGVATLLLALGWYVWRAASERGRAVRRARSLTGQRARRPAKAGIGRWSLGAAMALVAVLAGLVAAPLAVAGSTRDVLRTGIDPELRIRAALSPLTGYREFFADDAYDEVLFHVDSDGAPDRVRLATLSFYDGIVARVADPAGSGGAFVRVPAGTASPTSVTATIEIAGYRGIWVPLVGSLSSISFDGAARAALSDGFFYSDAADMGVQLSDPGLVAGVTYAETATATTVADADIAALTPSGSGSRLPREVVPDSLADWIRAQAAPGGGAGLQVLIERLRARGYLSHALDYDAADPPAWAADLGGYSFEASRAGHSADRIDTLFADLLQRQSDVGDGGDDAELVAAAGDDEQFAVAAALVADQLGFAARVVLGARLSSTDDDLPWCEDGDCRGGDMSAWIEVQDASGAWVAIDTTPQHADPIAPQVQERSDPQVPTAVRPEQAETVLPPDAAPADVGQTDDESRRSAPDLSALWTGLQIGGAALLVAAVLFGPFLAVILAKALRRRSRRGADDPVGRIVGGWDEYVDTAVDHGLPPPGTRTRQELAVLYDASHAGTAGTLASWADRSVFAEERPSTAEGEAFWALVDAERERMLTGLGWWRRLRTRVSLRSLRRPARKRGGAYAAAGGEGAGSGAGASTAGPGPAAASAHAMPPRAPDPEAARAPEASTLPSRRRGGRD